MLYLQFCSVITKNQNHFPFEISVQHHRQGLSYVRSKYRTPTFLRATAELTSRFCSLSHLNDRSFVLRKLLAAVQRVLATCTFVSIWLEALASLIAQL